jgi:cytochrome c oxidase assembly factor CtaG
MIDRALLALAIAVAGAAAIRWARRPYVLLAGVALAAASMLPPLADWAQRSLVGHMTQHLIHTDAIPPLIFFGVPLAARVFRAVPAPVSLFVSLALVWGIHFSPLFEASLEHAPYAVLVDVLFLAAGGLMWAPVFDPQRLDHAARLGYVFLAMPLISFLGFALYSNRVPLYPHYVHVCGAGALADQQAGGELMWVGGGTIMFLGFMLLAFEYARHEIRIAASHESGSP